jgi:recombinational DNA repair ATPase RecF
VGKNGVGKTNVLDAIYHLANGKSYFNPLAVQNIKHGEDFFVIEFALNNSHLIYYNFEQCHLRISRCIENIFFHFESISY